MSLAWLTELRLAARALWRSPSFLVVATLTLALGVGSVSSIYSVIRGTLLQPLPYPQPQDLVRVNRLRPPYSGPVTKPVFEAWREGSGGVFSAFAGFTPASVTLSGDGAAERLLAYRVTPEFWTAMDLPAQRGRYFGSEEESSGARVVVLSHALWQSRYAGDASVVGRDIEVEGEPARVVGIAPPDFAFPVRRGLYLPMNLPLSTVGPGSSFIRVVARLAPGVSKEQALSALQPINAALAAADPPNNKDFQAELQDLSASLNATAQRPLLLLMAASGLVLLIGCANLANLLLARASQRQRSLAIRSALGASRSALLRLTLFEATLIALAGGALGVLLAAFAVPALLRGASVLLPAHAQSAMNGPVIVASLAASVLTVLAFALWPALRAARSAPSSALQQETRGGVGRERSRAQAWLIAFEIALSLTLLTGAGLLLESLRRSASQDLGIRTEGVLSVAVGLVQPPAPDGADSDEERRLQAQYNQTRLIPLVQALEALPGVQAVAVADALPTQVVNNEVSSVMFPSRAPPADGAEVPWVNARYVSANYFALLGIALRGGTVYRDGDDAAGAPPRGVVVNETFVRRYLPGENPIGTVIANVGAGDPTTIVGVVADSRTFGAEQDIPAEAYLPTSAMAFGQVHLAVRVHGDPAQQVAALRDALQRFDAGMPILQLRPLEEAVAETDPFRRFNRDLMLAFSAVALLLTAFGVYAVIAYLVAQRRAELGIRMSLGADAGRIVSHVLVQGMRPVAAGVAIGIVGALLLGQALASQWFGLGAVEPLVLGAVVGTLVAVALLATAIPAWRATRIPAVEVLRGH